MHPQLISLLSTPDLASAKPGFLDRLIHAEATTARIPLVTFERVASRLPETLVLAAATDLRTVRRQFSRALKIS